MATLMQNSARLGTEFLGTLFLCLTVALTAGSSQIAPIAIGSVLMVLVYAGGHVSGAHYNPAVTVAIFVRGKIDLLDAVQYVAAQLTGGLCGSALSWSLIDKSAAGYPSVDAGSSVWEALLAEAFLTFALCAVVLHTATTRAQANNSYYGLAIGFTVLSGAVSVGSISGGAFNPAVGLTPVLYGQYVDLWIYSLGPILGALAAALFFRLVAREEFGEGPWGENNRLAVVMVEMVGTMMLCFTVGTAAVRGGSLTPLSIGSMLMCMVYMGGATSGAHYNPAVTGAIWLRSVFLNTDDGFNQIKKLQYIMAQAVGAVIGVWAAKFCVGGGTVGHPALPGSKTWEQGIVAEILGTFLLAYVVLNVATVRALAGNSFFGIAIGMTVTAMACALGPISGGAFNPAVGLTGLVTGEISFMMFLMYWIPDALGGLSAALFFRLQNPGEFAGSRDIAFMAHVGTTDAKPRFMVHAHMDAAAAAAPAESGEKNNESNIEAEA